jgi:hypothetical protein
MTAGQQEQLGSTNTGPMEQQLVAFVEDGLQEVVSFRCWTAKFMK